MVWRITPSFNFDANAAAYIAAVEAADGQSLETATRYAINNFVIGCKQDGIWNAIKASCILAGARTLAGALVPLVGVAPTNLGFAGSDYNRMTGLLGAASKNINPNRNNNQDPQNSKHFALFFSSISGASLLGANSGSGQSGRTFIQIGGSSHAINSGAIVIGQAPAIGFAGISRSSVNSVVFRTAGASYLASFASSAPANWPFGIFNGDGASATGVGSRIAFYSIGESLDLALLDARVTELMNALATAIP